MKKQLLTLVLALASTLWSVESVAQCTVQTGPLTESFDSQSGGSYNSPDLPSCWNYYSTATYPYAYVRNYSFYANSGTNAIYWYRSSSSSYNGDSAVVMSPKFDLSAGNYEVKFSTRSTSTSSFYNNVYYVGVADSAGTPSSITIVDTFTISSTTYSEYTVDLNAASGVGTGDSRVVFMMTGDGSTYGYALIDDIKIRVKNSCNDISNLSAVTSANGVSLSWDGDASHISYTIEYDTAGFTPGNGTTVTITSDSTEITGLTPVQNYDFYVNGNCSATSSGYAVMASAYSPCAAIATPWTENFDNTPSGTSSSPSLPQCWDFYANASLTYWYPYIYNRNYSFGSYSGNNFLYVYRSSSTSTSSAYIDTVMAIMPEIIGLDSANKQLKFYARNGSTGQPGEIIIGFTDAAGTPSSLRIIDTINASTSTYQEYTVYLDDAQSGDARVAFYFKHNSTFDYAYIDDVSITDIPPCPEPISLSLTSATKTDATIAWSSSSAAFDIEVGPMGFAQGTGTSFTSTTNSVTVTGLTQNTYYDAYLRSNCSSSGDGYSAWVGPFTFKTECGWFVQPYSQDFGYSDGTGSSTNPDLPDCWNYYETGGNSSGYAYVDKYYYWGNQATDSAYIFLASGYVSSFSGRLGDTIAAILPLLEDLDMNDKQLLFNARGYSGAGVGGQLDAVIVGTTDSTGDMSTFHIVDTILMAGSTYQDYTVDLTGLPSGAARVVMAVWTGINSGYSYGYNEVYVDHVELRQAPQCPEPFGFTTTVSTDTSATIDWSDSSVVSNYFIEWGQSGFTQGTGATIDTVSTSEWSSSSLTSNTTYDVYVQSECSALGINSPWFGPITITTPCSPTAKPLVEGFENLATTFGTATAPNFADCWVQDRGVSASYVRGMSNTYGTVYGNGYMEFWGMAMNSDTLAFSSPPIENLSTEGAEVTFYAYLNSASYLGELEVGVSDFSGSLSSARAATEIKLSTSWQQFSVYLDSNFLQSGDARVSFILPEGNGQWNDLRIDSVTIADLPSCGTYNHMIGSITDTSADLSWDYFGNDCFTIEYGLSGFIQGTGVGSQSGTIDSNITSNYVMSGLNPNTSYDFYVENCCSPGTWEGPFTFSTECTGPLAAGTYTVGSTGNFASLDSVISTLNVCGIAGAVTFELQSGTFVAGNSLGSVNGSSTANTITFTGASGASDTLVQISLSGASDVILDDLFIYNMSSDGVVLNETENVTISNSTIQVTTTSTSTLAGMPIASRSGQYYYNGSSESNLTIVNNELIGGYYGISLYGSSMNRSSNVHVADNTFSLQYYYGVNLSYTDGVTFNNNSVSGFRSSSAYGARFYYSNNIEAHENHISGVNYGMYVYQVNGTDNELVNNMLDANVYGIYSYFSDSVAVHHNTVRGNYGFYNYYSSNTDARNNIFIGNTYAVYARFGSNNDFDYNVYNSNGTYLAYTTTLIDSLGEWQTLDSLNNTNSVEGDPVFLSQNDLHVVGLLANDAGDNSVGVTHDIDGDVRPSLIASTVDIGADEFDVVYYDAAITGIVSPSGSACGGDSVEVIIEVTNLGVSLMTSVDATVNFAGQSITGTYAVDTLALGESEAIVVGYVSQRVGGFYSLDAEVDLTGDTRATNDLLSATVELLDAQQVSMNLPEFACAGDVIDLEITHPLDGTLMWSSNGDTLGVVDADSTMTLTLTQDTTLTLSAVASMDTTGNVRGIGSGGGNYTFMGPGLQFTVNQSSIIDSVTLYPNAAGSTTIDIKDAATGAIIWTSSVSTTATGNTAEQVYLGASMQPGSYTMTASASTCGGLYREFGVTGYPYSTSGNEVSITQGSLTNYHYFFYNWVVTVGGCERPDSTVTIMVHPDPVAAISVDDANATISATDWMANWSTAGTSGADSIYVEFSNGTSSNDTSGTVTFTANNAGETVTVIAFGPCSSDTATFTFDVNQISVDEDFMNGTLKIYPNPTRGLFNVEFATATATNVEISIVNMVGQVISNEVVTVNGLYNNQFDLSNESAGVYFIQFTTDNAVLTERITVE
jgi:hypothetical protein